MATFEYNEKSDELSFENWKLLQEAVEAFEAWCKPAADLHVTGTRRSNADKALNEATGHNFRFYGSFR